MVNRLEVKERTVKWIDQFVIGLSICPFAKHPFENELIDIQVYEGTDIEACLVRLSNMLIHLDQNPSTELETSLLVIPNFLAAFNDYLEFLTIAEELLVSLKLEGIIQLASFHPQYQFEGSHPEDLSNYTNRSPYPMIHLLREDSVYQAVRNHPNPDGIPTRNIKLLESMDPEVVKGYSK